jgi:hypothetical protein
MSKIKNRPSEIWVTKSNLIAHLPREVAQRIIVNATTLKLAGDVPQLKSSRASWDREANEAWDKASKYVATRQTSYQRLHSIIPWVESGNKNDIAINLCGGRGEAPHIFANWGKVLSEHYKLPLKWRFKNESLAYVPALLAELCVIAEGLVTRYENEGGRYAKVRRSSRATTQAIRKELGFRCKGVDPLSAEEWSDVFPRNSSVALDNCLQGHWSTSNHHIRLGKIGLILALSGSPQDHRGLGVDLRIKFDIGDASLRKQNYWKLAQLFKAVRDLTENKEGVRV